MKKIAGLASWILSFIASGIGIPDFFPNVFKKYIPTVYVKLFHNVVGLSAYATGIASLIYGLEYGLFSAHISDSNFSSLKYCIYIVVVYSGLEALRSMYYQFKSMF